MDCNGSGRLSDMVAIARYIDHNIIELEQVLTSVEGLMPTEENMPEAVKLMGEVSQEIKELEEQSHQLKLFLTNQFSASQEDAINASTITKAIEEGISQIENTLKQYGYDRSRLPTPEVTRVDDDDGYDDEEDEDDDDNSSSLTMAAMTKPASPGMNQLNESMASVEITPLVLSSKSSHNSRRYLTPSPEVSSQKFLLRIPASGGRPYLNGSSPLLKNSSHHKNKSEVEEQASMKHKVLVRPQRPNLSSVPF